MLTDEQVIAKYGQPGDEDNIVLIDLPYPMRYVVSETKTTEVKRMRCHKLIADNLTAVFNELLSVYGYDTIKKLGIDLFGGCVAVRLMRGSKTKWSRHSWGVAIDLHPLKNQLKWKAPQALFSDLLYKEMIDIFYKHGFMSLGREQDRDWMHMEING